MLYFFKQFNSVAELLLKINMLITHNFTKCCGVVVSIQEVQVSILDMRPDNITVAFRCFLDLKSNAGILP
jgi:hypothetical protein